MSKFLRVTDTRIINLDQVVDVEFTPARNVIDYEDDPNGKPYHVDAKLTVTLTSLKSEVHESEFHNDVYDGQFKGVASVSEIMTFHKEQAETIWRYICCEAGDALVSNL